MKSRYVYILTNRPDGVLYIGVTDDLGKRIWQHRQRAVPRFTNRYNCHRLVWFDYFENIHDARMTEARMKKWKREWNINRTVERNPDWRDLFEEVNA